MATRIEQDRARTLVGLLASVILLGGASLMGNTTGRVSLAPDARYETPVFGTVDTLIEATAIIEITLADEVYRLVRTAGDAWAMDRADGYPIRRDRLSTLAEGLRSLRWGEARTGDPRKHDRIGVGDPEQGGTGALVRFLEGDGTVRAAMVTGRRGDGLYARRPDEDVAYRVEGELPPFYSRDAWMDFRVVEISPETIQLAEIRDRFGDRLVVSRSAGMGPEGFAPAPPYLDQRLLTPLSAAGPALVLSRFAPLDAQPASALSTDPVAELVTVTFDGLEVIATAYDEPDGGYITLRAVEAGNAAARAASINAEAAGWAYKLPDMDYRDITAPVSTIAAPDF